MLSATLLLASLRSNSMGVPISTTVAAFVVDGKPDSKRGTRTRKDSLHCGPWPLSVTHCCGASRMIWRLMTSSAATPPVARANFRRVSALSEHHRVRSKIGKCDA